VEVVAAYLKPVDKELIKELADGEVGVGSLGDLQQPLD